MRLDVNVKVAFDPIVIQERSDPATTALLGSLLSSIQTLQGKVDQLQMTEDAVKAIVDQIDKATTKQGADLQIVADSLQNVSNDVDVLIESNKDKLSPETLAALQSKADALQTISDNLDAQAAFSKQVAAKFEAPVPPPVPSPDPIPATA